MPNSINYYKEISLNVIHVHIYTKEGKHDPKNYCPISLASIILESYGIINQRNFTRISSECKCFI